MTFQVRLSRYGVRMLALLLAIAGAATMALSFFGPRIGRGPPSDRYSTCGSA
jgi:hypothetical protein